MSAVGAELGSRGAADVAGSTIIKLNIWLLNVAVL